MMAEPSACPHCGKEAWLELTVRLYGTSVETYYEDGTFHAFDEHSVRYKRTRNIACVNCGELRDDVKFKDGEIVAKKTKESTNANQ